MPAQLPTLEEFDALATRVAALENQTPYTTTGGGVKWAGQTPNSGELLTSFSIDGVWRPIFRLTIPNVVAGDLLTLGAEAQFTNPTAYNVGVWSYLTASATLGSGRFELTEANGRNITKNMHHDTHTKTGMWVADADYPTLYVEMLARAASSLANGMTLNVDQDYGRLWVVNHGPATT